MTQDERLVYQVISKAGNKGIWSRDLRYQTSLDMKLLNKILKIMESRKMIKAVTSMVAAKKKMYMLFELQPSEALTGGQFYNGHELDAEFIGALQKLAIRFLESRATGAAAAHPSDPLQRISNSVVSVTEVMKFIESTHISTVALETNHVAAILDTLVFDGLAEAAALPSGERVFRISKLPPVTPDVLRAPCGVCPVFHNCTEGSVVSPSTCLYLKQWMDF